MESIIKRRKEENLIVHTNQQRTNGEIFHGKFLAHVSGDIQKEENK